MENGRLVVKNFINDEDLFKMYLYIEGTPEDPGCDFYCLMSVPTEDGIKMLRGRLNFDIEELEIGPSMRCYAMVCE